jgi:type I site-specific restriction-modification system R (restriction) subunit
MYVQRTAEAKGRILFSIQKFPRNNKKKTPPQGNYEKTSIIIHYLQNVNWIYT